MLEKFGDVFTFQTRDLKILRCVTTNGVVKSNNELIMGAGIALTAKQKFSGLPKILGNLVKEHGNHVYIIPEIQIASFPTKNHWRDNSDINLIEQSCKELVEKSKDWDLVVLPRPGCSLGKLEWDQVKPILIRYFSDKFIVLVQ